MGFLINPYRFTVAGFDDTGLKAYWKFNEASGDIINVSQSAVDLGSAADIQISGATYAQTGKIGNALSFDGINDVGVVGTSASQFNFMHNTTALFSINFWVKRITLAQPPVIFTTTSGSTNNIGVWINFVANNDIDFAIVRGVGGTYVITNAGNSLVNIADTTTWHMVTYTYDQSLASLNLKTYLDGTASTTLNKTVNAPSNSNATRAANMFSDANFGFGANYFDEMSIWNRILTQAEITSLYNSGAGLEIY